MKNLQIWFVSLLMSIGMSSCRNQRVVQDKHNNIKYFNLRYGEHKRNLYDVFVPHQVKNPTVVIVVHGGGWRIGDKAHLRQANRILLDAGIASIGMNYPLATKGKSDYRDQLSAIDLLVRRVKDSIGDRPLALLGESSGGHISLLYAYRNPDLIDKVIGFAPPTDLYSEQLREQKFYQWYTKSAFSRAVGDTYKWNEPIPETFKEASPISQVDKVPTLLIQGTWDLLVNPNQARTLDSVLTKNKVPHKLVILKGGNHTARAMPWWKEKVYSEVIDFIHQDYSQTE